MQNITFFIREHFILNIIWFSLLLLIILFTIQNLFSKHVIINNDQIMKLLNEDNGIIIDTRLTKIFNISHIQNSINLPLENILSDNIHLLEPYKCVPVILIISESNLFHLCSEKLYKHGFMHIYILEKGINDWNTKYLPLVSTGK